MMLMIEQTTSSVFDRSVNAIEKFVSGKPQGRTRLETIHAWAPDPFWEVEKQIGQLVQSGRAEKGHVAGQGAAIYVTVKRAEAA